MARYRRRRAIIKKRKYNIENRPLSFVSPQDLTNGFYQNQIQIVPPTVTEGVRQVARMTVSLTAETLDFQGDVANLFWALVYVPEGTNQTPLFPNANTLYQPSNYVLASGIADANAGPIRISSRLRKNLNANDQIFLLTATKASGYEFEGLVRYAVCFN